MPGGKGEQPDAAGEERLLPTVEAYKDVSTEDLEKEIIRVTVAEEKEWKKLEKANWHYQALLAILAAGEHRPASEDDKMGPRQTLLHFAPLPSASSNEKKKTPASSKSH